MTWNRASEYVEGNECARIIEENGGVGMSAGTSELGRLDVAARRQGAQAAAIRV